MAAVDLYSPELRDDAERACGTVGGAAVAKLFERGLWVVSAARLKELLLAEKQYNQHIEAMAQALKEGAAA